MSEKKTAQQLREEAEALIRGSREADEKARGLLAEARRVAAQERHDRENLARKLLSDRLYDEIGGRQRFNREQHDVIFDAAWDRGRGSGDYAVTSEYGELAEFARQVMERAD